MFSDSFYFGDMMFSIVPIFILIVFIIILISFFKAIKEWNFNNQSPKLTVPALVVTKRSSVSHHHHGNDNMHSSHSTTYYVTFQFDSGDRSEFTVNGREFGMLAEGDTGLLTFQGTRYLSFERQS